MSFPKGDSVNSGIPREYCSVSYEDYDYFVSIIAHEGRGCYIAKADIESAFIIKPISPSWTIICWVSWLMDIIFMTDAFPWVVPYHVSCLVTLLA